MRRLGGSFLLSALLTISFLSASPGVTQATAPTVLSAKYVDADNILEIAFDQPVYNDTVHVMRSGITLDGDNGGDNPDFTLRGGFLCCNAGFSTSIQLRITFGNQQIIETMADKESLKLLLGGNVFLNEGMEGNAAVSGDQAVAVTYVPDTAAPKVTSAAYDAGTNVLTIQFDSPVNGRQVELTRVALDDDHGGNKVDVKFNSINERIESASLSQTMKISFNPKHQQLIESMDANNLTMILQPFAFITSQGNTAKATSNDYIVNVTTAPDIKPTSLLSASYDAVENNLRLFFNEKIITTYREESAVNFKGIAIHDPAKSEIARLSGAAAISVTGETQMVIMVLPADQRLIENLTNKSGLKLTVDVFSILDESGNGIRAYALDDNIQVAYNEELATDAPSITEAKYNAATNILSLTFGNISAKTRGIDTTNVNLTGVVLDDDNGGSNPNVVLSGGTIKGIKSGVPAFIRTLEITLVEADEAKVENFVNKNQISVGVDPLSFFFESYTKTRNGNHKIDIGQITITYQADPLAPQLLSARYDYKDKVLSLDFDKLVSVTAFDPKAIGFGGVTLTGGTSQEQTASSTLHISVSAQDQASVEGLSVATKATPTVALAAGAAKNLDGVGNAQVTYQDGDLTGAGATIMVGYGRSFWDKSYELFPTVDQLVPASLRAVGEHSYFYVADDQWGINVKPADVQGLLTAFESSTPANSGKGIYQLCRETFGQEPNTDNDARVYILLSNLRDEYERASGDASADIPKAGAFEVRNEQKIAENPHSNEVDMVYVDSYPIVKAGYAPKVIATYLTNMIMHRVDANEEQWLNEGMAVLAQDICGFGYSNFRYPSELPSIPTNSPVTQWTGWTGGHPGTDINERNRVYLFFSYIFEQYGGVATISAIAAESENGIASVDKVLAAKAAGVTTWSVLYDLATACFADVQNDPTYGNKYGIASTALRSPTIQEMTFKTNEFTGAVNQWSLGFHLIKAANNPGKVNFNGDDNARFVVRLVALSPLTVSEVTLNEKNEAQVDVSMGDRSVYMVVTRKDIGPAGTASYVVSKDLAPPSYVELRVFQNPSVNKLIDFHVLASERLYGDVPPTEGPILTAKTGDSEVKYVAALEYSNARTNVYNYKASVEIRDGGDYTFSLSGQDAGGSDFVTKQVTAKVQKIVAENGGMLSEPTTSAKLEIPANAMKSDALFTAISSPNGKSVSFGPSSATLLAKARLTMPYDGSADEAKLGIFRMENDQWIYIGGTIDRKTKTIMVETDRLGEFSLQSGEFKPAESSDAVPEKYNLAQNYPNPFNPTTTIAFDLPKAGQVTIKVFDILGKEVATLANAYREAGSHSLVFDGKELGTGVYFYTIHANAFSMTRKMMVLK